jgi:retron-type reverse transcriptase
VAAFEYALEPNLLALQEELLNQTYRTGGYRNFLIQESKKRKISAAPFRDRVVHHALCNVIEPIFDSRFYFHSYACRRGKGTHQAVMKCSEYAEKNRFVLKCDIRKFFPSVDHEVLKGLIGERISDFRVMWLISLILESGEGILQSEYEMEWFRGDDLFSPLRERGLPIGNQTSQFFANLYLDPLDRFVKQALRCRHYIRYVDDFVVFSDSKQFLHEARAGIAEFLENLRLKLHPKKCTVFPIGTGVDFLGYRVFPGFRKIRKENVKRFKKRMKNFERDYSMELITGNEIRQSLMSWIGHARWANSFRLRKRIIPAFVFVKGGRSNEGIPALCEGI